MRAAPGQRPLRQSLNESPSEKEGKFTEQRGLFLAVTKPSMKVPPKRKGNSGIHTTPPTGSTPPQ